MRPIFTETAAPSMFAPTARVESTTMRNTAAISWITSTPKTSPANPLSFRCSSSNVFAMIVVDEMAIMPPRNRLVRSGQPSRVPHVNPATIISPISMSAVRMAGRPAVASLVILNSSPRPNMRKMTPISDQTEMLSVSETSGNHEMAGLTRNPAST